ncbi:hypothetical protein AGMMS50229_06520 [Campylobacterota bacterium]|nr:hypothetical protein AGMMS50229_06520 [Campylobacterota bacterium]
MKSLYENWVGAAFGICVGLLIYWFVSQSGSNGGVVAKKDEFSREIFGQ